MRIKSTENSGIVILLTGVVLLLITFLFAYGNLQADINTMSVLGIFFPFVDILSPLLEAAFRLLYLALMGWIASLVMIKGLNILWHVKVVSRSSVNSNE